MSTDYDVVIVGGGLGGSAFGKVMAECGAKVLVLERETEFRDRVRGEGMAAWGSVDAEKLGIFRVLRDTCAFETRWVIGFGPDRDLTANGIHKSPALSFPHPLMQEVMSRAAATAGAEVRRGATVHSVTPGATPSVEFQIDGRLQTATARLIVGADGRGSAVRRWGGFAVNSDRDRMLFAGVLLDGMGELRQDAWYMFIDPGVRQSAFLVPQGARRARAYLGYRVESNYRLQGASSLPRLIEEGVRCGLPRELYGAPRAVGPLATFNGADNWVEHPYANGIALIGDAAATSDPIYGQGMALTLRDVRVLRDALTAESDWNSAGHAYAAEHDRYYGIMHICEDLLTEMLYGTSAEAEARRAKALPLIADDPTRVLDHIVAGPELPLDDAVKARFWGDA
jgi:2-polyprenyl-6-methoxyphenol hydroxylase-like FAD-dependent oxidoreductase